jgi:photosynthetic reaction center cytochrome c subunit
MPGGSLFDKRFTFWVVFLLVTAVFLLSSLWVVNFVRTTVVEAAEEEAEPNPAYIDYSTAGDYVSAESDAAIQDYILEHPQPQNVQVLTGLSTSEIWAFMTAHMAGGMKQDCTYCHNLDNFASEGADIEDPDVAERRDIARTHLEMVADLNKNWLPLLDEIEGKQPSGAQVICATCHLGEAQPVSWPGDLHALPDDFRLPLEAVEGTTPGVVSEEPSVLRLTGDDNFSLDTVQQNQYTMYHFNESLQVGCTHCHNSRYFPEWEQPAKYYGYYMLQMNKHLLDEYGESMQDQQPSCYLCHRNNVRPPGAVLDADLIPASINSTGE